MKKTGSKKARKSESRRFRALVTFCQGLVGGIGSPMFELKRSAWMRGDRCEAIEVDRSLGVARRSDGKQSGPYPFRRSGGSDRL